MNEGVTPHHPLARDGTPPSTPPSNQDTHDLALALAPALIAHCHNRLGPIEWFRASWQRGGAATGFSTWELGPTPSGQSRRIGVIVKFPVGPAEHRWTTALGAVPHDHWHSQDSHKLPTPRVIASGTDLGGYDLAWLITERLQGPTLSSNLSEQSLLDLLAAAADFHAAALRAAPVTGRPRSPNWDKALDHAREVCKNHAIPESQHWNDVLKKVQKHLPILRARWDTRPMNDWCHGDLHPGNALRRATDNGNAQCVLIDLALVHPGHWIEDALYLERQFWGHEALLHGIKPLGTLAKFRREKGLPTEGDYPELANIRRVLTAACAPSLIEREGNLKYLHAALEVIERLLPQTIR